MDKIMFVDDEGLIHDEDESGDVLDLDRTEVLSFLDINHSLLPRDEGVGFCEYMESLMDDIDEQHAAEELNDKVDEWIKKIEAQEAQKGHARD